jgi:hypothetical protein
MTPPNRAAPALDADRLLSALWRLAFNIMNPFAGPVKYMCKLCGHIAPTKLAVVHAPGCVLRDVPAETLSALEAWERQGEPG